jgi:hypothetical protein
MDVVVFIDQQNLYKGARDAFCWRTAPSLRGNALPVPFARLVTTGERALLIDGETDVSKRVLKRVMVYMGMPSPKDSVEHGRALRQKQNWEYGHGDVIQVRHRPLKYPPGWVPGSAEKPEEKGIDVMLAMDLVRGTIDSDAECRFDLAMLACADTDLIPALEFVIDQRGADAIQTVAPENVNDRRNNRVGDGAAPIRAAKTEGRPKVNRTILVPVGAFERVSDRVDHYQQRSARQPAPDGRRIPARRRRDG